MRISTAALLGLLLLAPGASSGTAQPVTEPELDIIHQLVGECRPLAIAAYRTGDMRALDAYVLRLRADQANRQREIIACGAYLVGASDAGFYGPDPR